MDSIPYSEVRARLAETLKQLEVRDEPIFISRRGQPAGVLMSVAQYQRLQGGPSGFGEALLAWRARHAEELATEADDGSWEDPFADVRDRRIDGGRPPIDFTELLGDEPEGAASSEPSGGPAQPGRRKRP
ncbi:type II toxin-antitoxin system Phd/YefM family antitoxin [Sphaerotilus mobilis]|uniref:Antitoxin n=1 Tax=Sphaerotilus mobilis TaxID=47994 RepID=A0A4Q7LQZ1_9BURK|nr:type II toxin-antitoxin system Phd/YefM family antitoxin [Sphaerotilus mobilis]RZS57134.1 prevent-host-death family protein [Sphaerotilus mobilis]